MAVVLALALASIAFGTLAVAYRAAPEVLRRRDVSAIVLGLVPPALWSTFLPVHPTGLVLWDVALSAIWVTTIAVLAAVAERRVVTAIAVAVAISSVLGEAGLLAGSLAAGLATGASSLAIRLPAPKALAGGLVAVSLLQLDWPSATPPRVALAIGSLVALVTAAAVRAEPTTRRRVALGVASLAAFVLVAGAGFGYTALRVRADLRDAIDVARGGLREARAGDLGGAAVSLGRARDRFDVAARRLDGWLAQPVRLVPGAGRNHRAMAAIARSGSALASHAARVADDGDADDVRLRGGALDLERVDRLRVAVTDIAGELGVADRSLGRAASTWLLPPVEDALDDIGTEVAGAERSTTMTVHIARRLPALLGADGPRRWFVGVLGNSEARAAGGIIGSHGVLVTDAGSLDLGPMSRTAELNTSEDRTIDDLDEYVARYGRYEPQRTWQNVTMSPDGPTVARVVEQLYPQSGGEPVDGVLLVDPFGLAALVRLVGPVHVDTWPVAITAASLPEILLHEQYLAFPRPERIDFLGDVAAAAFDKLTDGELPPPITIATELAPAVHGGHLVLHSTDDAEQALFAELGIDGHLPPVRGDALAVVTQNASGNKIDWFLRRSVSYDVVVGPTGVAQAELDIRLTNLAPDAGLPDYVIAGSGPNPTRRGESRMILSVYSPLGLDDASIELLAERELGRHVYTGTVTLPPGGETTVHLSLSGRLDLEGGYRIDVREQPMVVPDEVVIRVNGRVLR